MHLQQDEFLNALPPSYSATEKHVGSAEEGWAAPECAGLYPLLTVLVSVACFSESATQRRNAVADFSLPAADSRIALWRESPLCPMHRIDTTHVTK